MYKPKLKRVGLINILTTGRITLIEPFYFMRKNKMHNIIHIIYNVIHRDMIIDHLIFPLIMKISFHDKVSPMGDILLFSCYLLLFY